MGEDPSQRGMGQRVYQVWKGSNVSAESSSFTVVFRIFICLFIYMFFEFFLVCFYYFCFLVDWLWYVVCTTIDSKTVAFLSGRAVALGCLVECYPLYCALSEYRWEVCCGILGREKIMRVRGCQSGSTLTEWVLLCQKGMGNFYVLQS